MVSDDERAMICKLKDDGVSVEEIAELMSIRHPDIEMNRVLFEIEEALGRDSTHVSEIAELRVKQKEQEEAQEIENLRIKEQESLMSFLDAFVTATRPIDYKIISAKTQAELMQKVSTETKGGRWFPQGGVSAAAFGMSPVGGNQYIQAMVRYK